MNHVAPPFLILTAILSQKRWLQFAGGILSYEC